MPWYYMRMAAQAAREVAGVSFVAPWCEIGCTHSPPSNVSPVRRLLTDPGVENYADGLVQAVQIHMGARRRC